MVLDYPGRSSLLGRTVLLGSAGELVFITFKAVSRINLVVEMRIRVAICKLQLGISPADLSEGTPFVISGALGVEGCPQMFSTRFIICPFWLGIRGGVWRLLIGISPADGSGGHPFSGVGLWS